MIETLCNRALKAVWSKGAPGKIAADLLPRLRTRLDALNAARLPQDMNVPGFSFHGLQGKPKRYSVHVNGPWCMTFEWEGENAVAVDFENYREAEQRQGRT